jgi:hypothetical protein
MIGEQDEDWRNWIPEAQSLIRAWESTVTARLLSVLIATALAEPIARGLCDAYARGRASKTCPDDRR